MNHHNLVALARSKYYADEKDLVRKMADAIEELTKGFPTEEAIGLRLMRSELNMPAAVAYRVGYIVNSMYTEAK